MKFVHKNTGYLVVLGLLAVAVPLYLVYDQEADFYQRWTCPMMDSYFAGNATSDSMLYKDLTDEEKDKFNIIYRSEC